MIRGKFLPNNELAIIEDGVVNLFDLGGKFKGTSSDLAKYMSGALNFKYISILSTPKSFEVACFNNDKMRRFQGIGVPTDYALKIQMQGGLTRILHKTGRVDNTSYNQLIFLYPENKDIDYIINSLGLKEIKE